MWFHYSMIQNGLKEEWKPQTTAEEIYILFGKKDHACTILVEYENK